MKSSSIASLLTSVLALASVSSGLNIIINNDDGWASANIRSLYNALKAAGHNPWIIAPVENQSGKGGTSDWSTEPVLSKDGQYGTVSAGAPSFGVDPNDDHIRYYNGTPAAVTIFALDWVVKNYWNGTEPDLFITGPNEGNNLGSFVFTLAGTLGAAYAAVDRGYPAVALSASSKNGQLRPYTEVSSSSDASVTIANLAVKLVAQMEKNANGGRLLPEGYGLNVNFPVLSDICQSPPYIQSRLTGGSEVDKAVYNATSGLFTWGSTYPADGVGLNACINGDCSLPGETNVVKKCQSSVSVFTVDYDAPSCSGPAGVRQGLMPLVSYLNQSSTSVTTGSAGNTTTAPNSTYSTTPSPSVLTGAGSRPTVGLTASLAFIFMGVVVALS